MSQTSDGWLHWGYTPLSFGQLIIFWSNLAERTLYGVVGCASSFCRKVTPVSGDQYRQGFESQETARQRRVKDYQQYLAHDVGF